MRDNTLHFDWQFRLQSSPARFWPYIANTDQLNADVGQPALDSRSDQRVALGNGRFRLRFTMLGIPVEWEEAPFEWVYPERYGVVRTYSSGPMTRMQVLIELVPEREGGTHLFYRVHASPRGVLGRLALPIYIGVVVARRLAVLVQRYDQMASAPQSPPVMPGKVHFAPGGHARLMRLRDQLHADGVPPDLLDRLVTVIEQADPIAAAQLRPYALADNWGVSRRAMLELFLRATRAGMLDFQWELLCPLCRNGSSRSDSLSSINPEVHCDSCNINYTVNFDRSVELTFRPNPAIRPVTHDEFCIGGPHRTPHIVSQQVVSSGEQRTLNLSLEPGRYRMRTLQYPGGQHFHVQPGGMPELLCYPDPQDAPEGEAHIAPVSTLHIANTTDREQVFILERMSWNDQAATAAEVTALQLFRSLFSSEALRPGERISVGSITIVFTDLRGSTRLYREIGDAPAFGRVMNHFDVLKTAVDHEGGALVKTIGDAVMAVFHRPVAALRAMLYAQHMLANPPAEDIAPLYLKAGIHTGACIAVNLNERLDYFGSTVNIAARLEGVSSGQDIVITHEVRTDPEVDALLIEHQAHVRAEPFSQTLKGFDTEEFNLWRVVALANSLAVLDGPAEQASDMTYQVIDV